MTVITFTDLALFTQARLLRNAHVSDSAACPSKFHCDPYLISLIGCVEDDKDGNGTLIQYLFNRLIWLWALLQPIESLFPRL